MMSDGGAYPPAVAAGGGVPPPIGISMGANGAILDGELVAAAAEAGIGVNMNGNPFAMEPIDALCPPLPLEPPLEDGELISCVSFLCFVVPMSNQCPLSRCHWESQSRRAKTAPPNPSYLCKLVPTPS